MFCFLFQGNKLLLLPSRKGGITQSEGPSTVQHLSGFGGGRPGERKREKEKKRQGEGTGKLGGDGERGRGREGEFEVPGPRRGKEEPTDKEGLKQKNSVKFHDGGWPKDILRPGRLIHLCLFALLLCKLCCYPFPKSSLKSLKFMNILCRLAFSGHQAGSSVLFLGQCSAEVLKRASDSHRPLNERRPSPFYGDLWGSE